MTWTVIRSLDAQGAEADAPAEGEFVPLGAYKRYVEVAFESLVFGGAPAPASVTFGLWRRSDGRTHKIGTTTIASGETPTPLILDFHGDQLHVRVESFSGGTTPDVSGTVVAREVVL